MCFSAEASFIAAATVGTVGYCALKEVTSRNQLPLAILPVLFSVQQFCEGVIWVYLKNNHPQSHLFFTLAHIYVLLSFIAWPAWFSYSALMVETVPWRRRALQTTMGLGVSLSIYFAWFFGIHGIHPTIVENSIRYAVGQPFTGAYYLSILTLPYLLSSARYLWVMGVAAPISFGIVSYQYWQNFASIWCFAAALLSCWLFVVVRNLKPIESPLPLPKAIPLSKQPEN